MGILWGPSLFTFCATVTLNSLHAGYFFHAFLVLLFFKNWTRTKTGHVQEMENHKLQKRFPCKYWY